MVATREKVYRKGTEAGKGSSREERGVALAKARFDEIVKVRPWTWSVPSASGYEPYLVDLRHEACSCKDRPPEGQVCKHIHAARYVRARTGECVGCRERHHDRNLYPVPEGNLTFFEGEVLCRQCALSHGVL